VGDSDVDFWKEVESTFGTHFPNDSSHGTAAYNVGYGGYTCEDVKNESSDFVSAFEPSKVVLVCGENDLSDGSTPAVTFASYQTAVMPYVHSGATKKTEPATIGLHNKYKKLDSLIKDWAATLDGQLVFIDTSGGFEDLGNGVDLYDGDKLHLSEVGYQYWEQWLTIALEDSSNCQVWRSGVCVQASQSPSSGSGSNEASASPSQSPSNLNKPKASKTKAKAPTKSGKQKNPKKNKTSKAQKGTK
jgi:lysophospholipase L1-like esterase